MKTLGEYQNDVEGLQGLDLENYERIFKVFNAASGSKEFYFYNILKKIDMPDNIDSQYTGMHTPKSDLPLTIISHNIYNDIRLWWLIYLLNKKVIGSNIFVVPASTQLKYILPPYLSIVFNQITNLIIFNGRHY